VKKLRSLRPRDEAWPKKTAGVYLAYRESDKPVSFLRHSPAGQRRGDPTLPLASLRGGLWVPDSRVVYIGKAARPKSTSTNSLRRRVSAYLRFGAGSKASHSGGYPTWQLRDSADLLIAWCVIDPPETPACFEHDLIEAHIARFGARPFANSNSGSCDLDQGG
jgi:hypothetical protein